MSSAYRGVVLGHPRHPTGPVRPRSRLSSYKLNGVNPQVYLTGLLTRLVNGWPQSRIDELMPWH